MVVDSAVLGRVSDELQADVYMLVDPDTGVPFYVGKGHRLRHGDHVAEVLASMAEALSPVEESPDEASRKIAKIKEIMARGPGSGISVEGEGSKAPGAVPLISWMSQCPHVIYWGDIDAKGLRIVNDLHTKGIKVDTVLMDYATYEAYEKFGAWTDEKGKTIPCSPRRSLPALTPDEHLLYLHLTDPPGSESAAWSRNAYRSTWPRSPLHPAWKPACGERRIVQMILAGKSGLVPFAGCRPRGERRH
jgi:hypothetical protein